MRNYESSQNSIYHVLPLSLAEMLQSILAKVCEVILLRWERTAYVSVSE